MRVPTKREILTIVAVVAMIANRFVVGAIPPADVEPIAAAIVVLINVWAYRPKRRRPRKGSDAPS